MRLETFFKKCIEKNFSSKKEKVFDILVVLIIGTIALILRVINLAYPRWYPDEGTNLQLGLNMLHGQYGYSTWGPNFFPPFYDFLIGSMVTLFGNSYFIARLPSAVLGTISCVLLFFYHKEIL
ncbi:MAG: hypothetical protein QG670_1922 [Thermoproteota archaeon]|nr:hypothetical protein [Thermoproteota archaeon]